MTAKEKAKEFLESLSSTLTPIGFEPGYEEIDLRSDGKIEITVPFTSIGYKFKTIKSTYNGKEVELLQGEWIYA